MAKKILVLASWPRRIEISEKIAQQYGGVTAIRANSQFSTTECDDGTRIDGNDATIDLRGLRYDELWISEKPDDAEAWYLAARVVNHNTENIHYFKELDDESDSSI